MIGRLFPGFPAGRVGLGLLIFRVVMGVAFALHGYPKITNIAGFSQMAGVPVFLGAAAAVSEFVGGLLLILGLLTPVAAVFIGIVMLTAIFKVHVPAGDPFVGQPKSWETAGIYLAACAAFLLMGPGAYSLDARIFGRDHEPR